MKEDHDYNIVAEQLLLGMLMNCNEDYWKMCHMLTDEDFYEPVHGRIYLEIQSEMMSGGAPNPEILGPRFENDPALFDIGGGSYLLKLTGVSTGQYNIKSYAKEIKKYSQIRAMRDVIDRYSRKETHDAIELGCGLVGEIMTLIGDHSKAYTGTLFDISISSVEKMEQNLPCYSTGIRALDYAMQGGLYQSKSYCIAARPKSGKTMLLGTVSYNMATAGIRTFYIACEMGPEEINERNLARAVSRNSLAFVSDRKNKKFKEAVCDAAHKQSKTSYMHNGAGISFEELKLIMQTMVKNKNIQVFFIDYLQLVKGKDRNQSDAEFQLEVAQWVAEFARANKVAVCYAAQLNRDGNVRGSDGVVMAADQVYQMEMNENKDKAWLMQKVSRYTQYMDVGSEESPALRLNMHGPHFEDIDNPVGNEVIYSAIH